MCSDMPDGVFTDTIKSIKKIGSLGELESSEIILNLARFGTYSFDYFCHWQYEDFWLNAHLGSRVKVSISSGHISQIQLI